MTKRNPPKDASAAPKRITKLGARMIPITKHDKRRLRKQLLKLPKVKPADLAGMCTQDADHTKDLVTLRVSVARVAQAAGVSLTGVCCADDAPFEILHKAATTKQRGWNRLCAAIVDAIIDASKTLTDAGNELARMREQEDNATLVERAHTQGMVRVLATLVQADDPDLRRALLASQAYRTLVADRRIIDFMLYDK